MLYYLVILLRLGDFYLREEVDGYYDREILSFSDKLCHLAGDLLRERRGDEEVKVFLVVSSNVGDRVLWDPPPLDNPCRKVRVLLGDNADAVCGPDRVR